MRLWTISPKYLDSKGLVALWREALLAKAVLSGQTKGYKQHPQLLRFNNSESPKDAINFYLSFVFNEAVNRGYNFDDKKIAEIGAEPKINVTKGQVDYEWKHLQSKIQLRDPSIFHLNSKVQIIDVMGIFQVVQGEIESWEKLT
ncbi:MAG: pyrimidine dimer DNA glycosylase/endonuclease V [Candidatus Dojkabacteria bacterium]|nr:pyrimidine dimer DNA glycosylase/endonuclease V [Candidatus Dojkabacteria bacterium]